MNDTNKVIEIGRLTRGADISYTSGGTCCAKFSIAVNEGKKDVAGKWTDYANFFDVVLWGKTAEILNPYLTKGRQVAIEGRLRQDRWEKDGQKFSRINIVADSVQLLGGKNDGNGSQPAQTAQSGFTEDIPF